MSYKSPITLIQDRVQFSMDDQILKAVQNVGIDVDKSELLRALKYDRNQYQKGYEDGKAISQWIPTSERLPEFRKQVLCCNEDGRVFTSCLTKIHIYFGGVFGHHYGVIAWMPLPEPFEGGGN